MKKQDTERDNANPLAVLGFGKVLSSLQGLQQRLGDFSYGEVSIAEAKVKILVKQLSALHDNLSRLVRFKLIVGDVHRCVSEISAPQFDQVKMNGLENHPRLHAILQASKLVGRQKLSQDDFPDLQVETFDTGSTDSPVHSLPRKASGAHVAIEPFANIMETGSTDATDTAAGSAEAAWVNDPKSFTLYSVTPKANMKPLPTKDTPSFTIPRETTAGSQETEGGGRTADWSFDDPEVALTSTGNFASRIDFEFPDESKSAPEPPRNKAKASQSSRSEPAFRGPDSPALSKKPITMATKSAVAPPTAPTTPASEHILAKLADSKALVRAKPDIDQRLLDDVIRNYGDFAGSPNLPATLDTNTKMIPLTETAKTNPTAEFARPTAAERKILNVQKSGDLDRQLKKIIQDYGEYDIYQRKSGITFKTGGLIAFAVLGLVLAALYLFKSPPAVPAPQSGAVKQSQRSPAQDSLEAISSPAVEARPTSPDPADASSSAAKDDKQ